MKKFYFLCMLSSAWCQPHYEASFHTTRELNSDGTISDHVFESATAPNGKELTDVSFDRILTDLNTQTHQEQVTHNDGQHTITMNDIPVPAKELLQYIISFSLKNSISCEVRFPNTDVIEAPTTEHRIKKSLLLKEFDNENPVIDNLSDLQSISPDLDYSHEDFITVFNLNNGPNNSHKQKLVDCSIYDVKHSVRKEDNDAVVTCAITPVDSILALTNDQNGQHRRPNIQNDGTIVQSSFEDFKELHGDVIPLTIFPHTGQPKTWEFFDIPQEVKKFTFSLRKIKDPQ